MPQLIVGGRKEAQTVLFLVILQVLVPHLLFYFKV